MIEGFLDQFGEGAVLATAGLVSGLCFGAMAQHSRFCLRAATVEVSEGVFGPRLSTWLIAFCAAVVSVQGLIVLGLFDASASRQLATTGSMSGAIIGGLLFGCGMILARGCASRLLVLSATGNLRALITGLVLTLVAQGSLRGALSPLRESISSIWLIEGGQTRDILAILHLSPESVAILGVIGLGLGAVLARHRDVGVSRSLAAGGVGAAIGLGWLLTYTVAQASFEVVPISSVTFTGPSADTLMGLINASDLPLGFGIGLVPGVFVGACGMAVLNREAAIERFGADTPMERYLLGAVLMGFGSMLAGGCAVGAGMSGGSIFALTAWVALFFMWLGAMATHAALVQVQMRRSSAA